jgi:hypothetical protein
MKFMRMRGIDQTIWLQHAWVNRFQSLSLLAFVGGFLALLGWLLWGGSGVLVLLIAGAIFVFLNPTLKCGTRNRNFGRNAASVTRNRSQATVRNTRGYGLTN